MKIQTSAIVKDLHIGEHPISLDKSIPIDLEFSAIDTGGGFKDPILDFSISLESMDISKTDNQQIISATLKNPSKSNGEVSFSHKATVTTSDSMVEINGRLKDKQLSRELIGFVLKLLR